MYMAKEMDAGDILSQRKIPITDEDTSGTMFERLSYLGRDLLMETIPLLVDNKITPIKQDHNLATFAYNIKPEEEIIDFNKTAREIFNHIRAYNPEPGAYFTLCDCKIKVFKSKVSDKTHNKKSVKSLRLENIILVSLVVKAQYWMCMKFNQQVKNNELSRLQ